MNDEHPLDVGVDSGFVFSTPIRVIDNIVRTISRLLETDKSKLVKRIYMT